MLAPVDNEGTLKPFKSAQYCGVEGLTTPSSLYFCPSLWRFLKTYSGNQSEDRYVSEQTKHPQREGKHQVCKTPPLVLPSLCVALETGVMIPSFHSLKEGRFLSIGISSRAGAYSEWHHQIPPPPAAFILPRCSPCFVWFCCFALLEIEPKALCVLGTHPTDWAAVPGTTSFTFWSVSHPKTSVGVIQKGSL